MAGPKKGSAGAYREKAKGKKTISLSEKARQMLKTKGVKDMAMPTGGGLMARLAAQRLAKAAGAAKPAAAEAAKAGAKTSPWVAKAGAGTLPPKALMGGGAIGGALESAKKRMVKSPPKKAPVRGGASSNTLKRKAKAMPKKAAISRRRAS